MECNQEIKKMDKVTETLHNAMHEHTFLTFSEFAKELTNVLTALSYDGKIGEKFGVKFNSATGSATVEYTSKPTPTTLTIHGVTVNSTDER